jgi:hypothetical protein
MVGIDTVIHPIRIVGERPMSARRNRFLSRAATLAGVALLALLLPATTLATNNSDAIDTEFSVSVQGCDATLTAIAGEDERETGSFAIYQGETVVVEGEYAINLGETLSFGPYPLATGSYLLVWDSEPGHDPSQSHSELAFDVVCEPEPTPTPTEEAVLPTTGVNPTRDPRTLPPTDAIASSAPVSTSSTIWPIALGLGLVAGLAILLTPAPARIRNRRQD